MASAPHRDISLDDMPPENSRNKWISKSNDTASEDNHPSTPKETNDPIDLSLGGSRQVTPLMTDSILPGHNHEIARFLDDSSASVATEHFITPSRGIDIEDPKQKISGKRKTPPRIARPRNSRGLGPAAKTIESENENEPDSPMRSALSSSTNSSSTLSNSNSETAPFRRPGEFDSVRTDSEMTTSSGGSGGRRARSPLAYLPISPLSSIASTSSTPKRATAKLNSPESPDSSRTDEEAKEGSTPRLDPGGCEEGNFQAHARNRTSLDRAPHATAGLDEAGERGHHLRIAENQAVTSAGASRVTDDDPEAGLLRSSPPKPPPTVGPRGATRARKQKKGKPPTPPLAPWSAQAAANCAWFTRKVVAADIDDPGERREQLIANVFFAVFLALLLLLAFWMLRFFPNAGGFPV